MVTHVVLNWEAKKEEEEENTEGDETPVQTWKEHHAEGREVIRKLNDQSVDCHLMHRKVDQIAKGLGIVLYHSGM